MLLFHPFRLGFSLNLKVNWLAGQKVSSSHLSLPLLNRTRVESSVSYFGQVSSTERESVDKGATEVLEAAIPHPAQGLLTAKGTARGPRAGKGVGESHNQR